MENYFPVEVVRKKAAARGITAFRVAAAGRLADSPPGAHIDVRLPSGTVRQYSLTQEQTAAPEYYEFAVLREQYGRGGSVEIVDRVECGDKLEITAPRSNFELDTSQARYFLLGAGVGITPLLGMARALDGIGARFSFHICAKTADHVPFKSELDASPYADAVKYYLSQDNQSLRVHLPSLLSAVYSDTQVYACGPDRFLKEIERLTAHWPAGRLRVERFTNELEELPDELSGEFTIELRKRGGQFAVPSGKSILDVLDEAGVPAPSSCKEGVCGTCIAQVLGGEIIHRDACLYDEEKEANTAIACCVSRGRPGSTVVLDI